MTEGATKRRGDKSTQGWRRGGPSCLAVLALATGCSTGGDNPRAVCSYYEYDFASARESVRHEARHSPDEQLLLNNARLGMAALADGDRVEAEAALAPLFDLLSTPGLNQGRALAAVIWHEGVRVWKGEPFEQALLYEYIAILYALDGDWENVRAAADNALRRLADFDAARGAAPPGHGASDVPFVFGQLLYAIAADLGGGPDPARVFDRVVEIDSAIEPVVDRLRAGDYDTLLIVDYGKGPTKIAWGPDGVHSDFVPHEEQHGPLDVVVDGRRMEPVPPACDVLRLADAYRWDHLQSARTVKSAVGHELMAGGDAVAHHGSYHDDGGTVLAGLGMIAVGMLSRSGARADTRYIEYVADTMYLVPLRLDRVSDVTVAVSGDPESAVRLVDLEPGKVDQPRAVYVRVHGVDSPAPPWLGASSPVYGNDFTGVRPGDYPWILGGRDVSTPSRVALAAYQAGGHLPGYSLADLRNLYRAEGIGFGSGWNVRADARGNDSYRHILEGGSGLFTPDPWSIGYKRLMFSPHGRYRPTSDLVRRATEQIGAARATIATETER